MEQGRTAVEKGVASMKTPMRFTANALLCLLVLGCSSGDPDFCSLLSINEVQTFDAGIVSGEMGVRGETFPTRYCIYRNTIDEEVLLLSIGNPTKNLPYYILQTYVPYMEGENRVEMIDGLGLSAAALFSDDEETDRLRFLLANGDDWSVTIRAKGVSDTQSEKFALLKNLGNKALSRF
jgi:hypothetical protein